MDYEKNKEALAIVKQMIADGQIAEDVAAKYFPELAESEDERIRKALIRFHKSTIGIDGIKGEDILAWLERQGEQKPVKEQQKEIDYAYRRGLADCHKAYNKEPSETDFIRKEIYDIIAALPLSDKRTEMLLWLESKKFYTVTNKHKPVEDINGEDYGIDGLWHAIRILEQTLGAVEGYQSDDGILEHKCAITAVKELSEQKPAWSEEDRDLIEEIISHYRHLIAIGSLDSERYKSYIIPKLKSLRPQNTWKPSKEQMAALESVINNLDIMHKAVGYMDNYTKKHLEAILEQLKAL